ncbi:cupin domain-containing protein [Paenibacillus rubinfantis]|uniref:cupin domain-containing protein n=1 Tax=Paenibacillus rubinfantis TaxID=1720296 RepID=UPI00073F4B06|nr:cupin domain-containing protein [Paenibacillus rubinfantis]
MENILAVLGGPRIQHLTTLMEDEGYCLMRAEFGPGVFVPLHSHEDRETFYVLSGELEAWSDGSWTSIRAGEIFDVPANTKHSIKNGSNESTFVIAVSTVRMGEFFKKVGRPAQSVKPGPPEPADLQNFRTVAAQYGFWLGSPEDNAAIGIKLG